MVAALTLCWTASFPPPVHGQPADRPTDTRSVDEIETLAPTAATMAIWTDKPGYARRELVDLYLAIDPAGDRRHWRQFLYLENIETRERQYILLEDGRAHHRFSDEIVDVHGTSSRVLNTAQLEHLPPTRILTKRWLPAGLWQFVFELRSPDTTESVKRAHAKFVVSPRAPLVLGRDGRDTEIDRDALWSNDTIYTLRHQVFVQAGATLTIEPGTLILGRGPQSFIVVERGGRIEALGRADAPVVMTCDAPLGQRFEGCWGGLVLLGNAPMTRGTGLATSIAPEGRAVYGGDDPLDSSGALQYTRVEFAGASGVGGAASAGLGMYGVGVGTLIDHVQVHASAGDGILFAGGTAHCSHCVASGPGDDALAWRLGWRGTAQHIYLQLGPAGGDCGIEGENDERSFDAWPRSAPELYNLTLVGSPATGREPASHGGGILLHHGTEVTAKNAVVLGFPRGALDARDVSATLFAVGSSRIDHLIVHANGSSSTGPQINGALQQLVSHRDLEPKLVNVRYRSNPDPRPLLNSPARLAGAAATPPSDGSRDTQAQYVGAFGPSNWLEEWTFFGPEADYVVPEEAGEPAQR